MKYGIVMAAALLMASPVLALDGQPGMHDPSTVVVHDGKYYVYATGNGLPIAISDDGWTWRRAGSLMQALPGGRPGAEVIARGGNNTWAPDVIRSGDRYFVYLLRTGDAAEGRDRIARRQMCGWQSDRTRRRSGGSMAAKSSASTTIVRASSTTASRSG